MENQHRQINGYRDFNQDEINAIKEVKELAETVGQHIEKLKELAKNGNVEIDPRWLAEGNTDLQKGFMSVVRSIARPTTF